MLPTFTGLIDQLASKFANPPWAGEVERARREFDGDRGEIFEENDLLESHIALFIEWYLLERPLRDSSPPILLALREEKWSPEEERQLRALALSYHSLFEVVDTLRRELLLSDLIGGGLWRVDQDPPFEGVDPGDIFEARIIPWEGHVFFGPNFLFHPRPARGSIHELLHQAEKDQDDHRDLISILAKMRLRHLRMRNIAVEKIYAFDKLGGEV